MRTELAKLYAVNDPYKLGRATKLQAYVRYRQSRLEDAKSEASHALEIYETLGATKDAGRCRDFLQKINERM